RRGGGGVAPPPPPVLLRRPRPHLQSPRRSEAASKPPCRRHAHCGRAVLRSLKPCGFSSASATPPPSPRATAIISGSWPFRRSRVATTCRHGGGGFKVLRLREISRTSERSCCCPARI